MRGRSRPEASDVEEEDLEDDEEPSGPPRRRGGPHARPSVKPWSPAEADEEDPSEDDEPGGVLGFLHRPRRPVYFRARDSVYFEPLVALAIILLLLVSLYAYTQNWPPVYVVESDSMQHGTTDNLGLINTGDLVLAQKLSLDQVTTYVVGVQTHYTTYGEYGDVLLYHPDGQAGTPVIHRAILFLQANGDGTWNAPSLAGLSCGAAAGAFYSVSSTANGCGTTGLTGTITLHGIGWRSVDVVIPLGTLGSSSGFVTMGDNNYIASGNPETGLTDQSAGISALVQPGWIVGAARGMLPWFGAVKLLLSGSSAEVPMQSWEWLGLTIVGVVLLAMGLHYLLRAEGVEDPRRKAEEEEAEEDDEEEGPPPSGPRRWLHPIRAWRESEEDDDEEAPPIRPKGARSGEHRTWGGRPQPSVGRKPAPKSKSRHESREKDDRL